MASGSAVASGGQTAKDMGSSLFAEVSPFLSELEASVGAVEGSQAALSQRIESVIDGEETPGATVVCACGDGVNTSVVVHARNVLLYRRGVALASRRAASHPGRARAAAAHWAARGTAAQSPGAG